MQRKTGTSTLRGILILLYVELSIRVSSLFYNLIHCLWGNLSNNMRHLYCLWHRKMKSCAIGAQNCICFVIDLQGRSGSTPELHLFCNRLARSFRVDSEIGKERYFLTLGLSCTVEFAFGRSPRNIYFFYRV